MNKIEVGKLFKEGVTKYQEGVRFDIDDNGMNLFIYYIHPTEEEKSNIKKGKVQYGYYKKDNVIMMLFKFGFLEWMDAPYSIKLSKNLSELKDISEGMGYATNVYLINAANGVLEGLRLISFSTRISKLLREDLIKQKDMTLDGYDKNIADIYAAYSSKELVKKAKAIGVV